MNKKNIIIFSLATTLLLANCLEGMKEKKKYLRMQFTGGYLIVKGNDYKKQNIIDLALGKNRLPFFFECYGGTTTDDLNVLLKSDCNFIGLYVVNYGDNIDWRKLDFSKLKNLNTLEFHYERNPRHSHSSTLKTKTLNLIFANNPQINSVKLENFSSLQNEKINFDKLLNLTTLNLNATRLSKESWNTVFDNNKQLKHLIVTYPSIPKNANLSSLKSLENLTVTGALAKDANTTDKHLKTIFLNNKKLKTVRFIDPSNVPSDTIEYLRDSYPNIKIII